MLFIMSVNTVRDNSKPTRELELYAAYYYQSKPDKKKDGVDLGVDDAKRRNNNYL
jgi:hypothetical protein